MYQIQNKNYSIGETRTKSMKKQIGKYKYIFQENPSKTKVEERRITDRREVKFTKQRRVKRMKYARAGMLNRILGGEKIKVTKSFKKAANFGF